MPRLPGWSIPFGVSAQLADRDQAIERLAARVAEYDGAVSARVEDRERALAAVSAELAAIMDSKAWRLALACADFASFLCRRTPAWPERSRS